jgi:hypothetical protein
LILHNVAAPLVGTRPAVNPATAGMTRGDGPGKLAISGEDDPLAPRSARMHYSLLGEALALTPLLVLRRSVRGAPFGLWGIRMLETAGLGCGCSEALAAPSMVQLLLLLERPRWPPSLACPAMPMAASITHPLTPSASCQHRRQ